MTHLLSKHVLEFNGLKLGYEPLGPDVPFWGVTTFEGLGAPASVYASGQRAQRDGLWRTRGFAGGRTINVAGFCHHPPEGNPWLLHNALNNAVSRDEKPLTYIYPGGTRRQIWAARDGEVTIETRGQWWFEWSFSLLASDPRWYYLTPITGRTTLKGM